MDVPKGADRLTEILGTVRSRAKNREQSNLDCRSGGCGFESRRPRLKVAAGQKLAAIAVCGPSKVPIRFGRNWVDIKASADLHRVLKAATEWLGKQAAGRA